jgi:hypothetical protein
LNEFIDPELDVLPKLLIELRDDPVVSSIVGDRVRGKDPEGPLLNNDGEEIAPGDVRGPGEYVPFVVLSRLGGPPHPRVPIITARISIRCYGRSDREAAVLRNACSRALHGKDARTFANGLGIYVSHDVTGGDQDSDPDTSQPLESFVVEAVASTQPVVV